MYYVALIRKEHLSRKLAFADAWALICFLLLGTLLVYADPWKCIAASRASDED